jgi:hypothetical protein
MVVDAAGAGAVDAGAAWKEAMGGAAPKLGAVLDVGTVPNARGSLATGAGSLVAAAPNTNGLLAGAEKLGREGGGEVVISSDGLAGAGVELLGSPNLIVTDGATLVIAAAEPPSFPVDNPPKDPASEVG